MLTQWNPHIRLFLYFNEENPTIFLNFLKNFLLSFYLFFLNSFLEKFGIFLLNCISFILIQETKCAKTIMINIARRKKN